MKLTTDQACTRQAALENRNAELLRELQHADRIIRNALNIMSVSQKTVWAERNAHDGVDGEGVTRANERLVVLAAAARSVA